MHLTSSKQAKRIKRSKRIAKKLNMGRNTKNRDNIGSKDRFIKSYKTNGLSETKEFNRSTDEFALKSKDGIYGVGSKIASFFKKLTKTGG